MIPTEHQLPYFPGLHHTFCYAKTGPREFRVQAKPMLIVIRLREEKTAKEAESNIMKAELNSLREESKTRDEELTKSRRETAALKGENTVMESEIESLKKDKHGMSPSPVWRKLGCV